MTDELHKCARCDEDAIVGYQDEGFCQVHFEAELAKVKEQIFEALSRANELRMYRDSKDE